MRIAFYAPLKAPTHPVPSGDREMARLLVRALEMAGHEVGLASSLRSYCRDPEDRASAAAIARDAEDEVARLAALWTRTGPPDLWIAYHPYYKAPDLIGPALAARFQIPRVTVEASYSRRRNIGVWTAMQAGVLEAIRGAAVNVCMTRRDLAGIAEAAADAVTAHLPPFIDTAGYAAPAAASREPARLMTVAMMRAGDKLESYRMLAQALALLDPALGWSLTVVGSGSMQAAVHDAFAGIDAGRIDWRGELAAGEVAERLSTAALYVWPGCGEAYGLAYLEAQACGLPVVAQATAGVPEVVEHGVTGLLTPPGDPEALAAAIARLLGDAAERRRMGDAARKRVTARHSLAVAAERLDAILAEALARRT